MSAIQHEVSLGHSWYRPRTRSPHFAGLRLGRQSVDGNPETRPHRLFCEHHSAVTPISTPDGSGLAPPQIMPMSNPQSHFHRLQVAVRNQTTLPLGSAWGGSLALAGEALGLARVYAGPCGSQGPSTALSSAQATRPLTVHQFPPSVSARTSRDAARLSAKISETPAKLQLHDSCPSRGLYSSGGASSRTDGTSPT